MSELDFNRREALTAVGLLSAGAALGLSRFPGARELFTGTSTAHEAIAAAGSCKLATEVTEGPYYLEDSSVVRRNITEGKSGASYRLRLRVTGSDDCKPIKGAKVDIWHTDAQGAYSGVSGNTGKFMRGRQATDSKGYATFDTVYPGWYTGRTPHIHLKVYVKGNEVHTGQLFFTDSISDTVYAASAYSGRGTRDTKNGNDGIYVADGLVAVRKSGGRYVSSKTLVVDA